MSVLEVKTIKLPDSENLGHLNDRLVKLVPGPAGSLAVFVDSGKVCWVITEAVHFRNEVPPEMIAEYVAALTADSLERIKAAGDSPEDAVLTWIAIQFLDQETPMEALMRRSIRLGL